MKILFLDIETAPNTAHVWGLFKQNIGVNQVRESSYVLCWAAKWYGSDEVMYDSVHYSSHKKMLRGVHRLLDEADAVVHYNGTKFDIPTLNKEFLLHGFKPPSPVRQIDLLKTARNKFKFPSNRLDYVAQALKVGKKFKHEGHELWIKCMAGDPVAWEVMEEYNKGDVDLLEKVYEQFKPWITGHANLSLNEGGRLVCPTCASHKVTKRGYAYTQTYKYQRFQCRTCGHWFRTGANLGPKPGFKSISL